MSKALPWAWILPNQAAGISFKRPGRRPQSGRIQKKLKTYFSKKKTRVVFQDEVHFTVEATITRQWFPKGSCPKVKSYPGRKSVAYSGFVTYGSGELFVTKPSWFNFETTIASIREFLAAVRLKRGEKIILVMDRGTRKQSAWLKANRNTLTSVKRLPLSHCRPILPTWTPLNKSGELPAGRKHTTDSGRILRRLPLPLMIGSILSLCPTLSWHRFVRSLGEIINVVYYS